MKRTTLAAWAAFGLITLASIWAAVLDTAAVMRGASATPWFSYLVGPTFALVGALILARQPHNRVGWLMLLPGASLFVLVDAYLQPLIDGSVPLPLTLTPGLWLALWFSNWNWTLLVFPLMWLMLLFPTGRPISRRWGWLGWFGVFLTLLLLFLATFGTPMQPGSGSVDDWSYPNPIGLFRVDGLTETAIGAAFTLLIPAWVILCLVALGVRYRRAGTVERQQFKWLIFATAVFATTYIATFLLTDFNFGPNTRFWAYLWMVAMLLIPASIGIAILRYRLYDIDIIIRKTLVYAVLSGLLALVYFGAVILLQSVFESASGQQSPLAIVISTLLIAALFAPLRQRVQAFIDRRLYRRKYDAQQILAGFANIARDETDVEALQGEMVRVVQQTLQPERVTLWLKQPTERGSNE